MVLENSTSLSPNSKTARCQGIEIVRSVKVDDLREECVGPSLTRMLWRVPVGGLGLWRCISICYPGTVKAESDKLDMASPS